ncbi:Flp pilus assembly protein CpaB [Erysipelothrix rhusiopathiae]|uniref:Flp pilus assembly protein CpaB n=1 Tax=Erysipelothrix rhusiopathiae TaxID=1648 RepID=UPI002B2459C9|nr:Flp pilus assembly protein CpaB [Erysipelothrix rhusiopathiae]WRB92427.1 Flp pilus assembly protein CpaB [Erysipelothrix rhusiopathiae]
MDKNKLISVVVVAGVFLLALMNPIQGLKKEIPKKDLTQVVVALKPLTAQTRITQDMIEVKNVHKDAAPEGAFADAERVVGKVTTTKMSVGDMFTGEKVEVVGQGSSGLSTVLTDNMRAYTVKLEGQYGMQGLIRVGNKIDIITVLDSDLPEDTLQKYDYLKKNYPQLYAGSVETAVDGKERIPVLGLKEKKAVLLLQNKEVLAIDQDTLPDDKKVADKMYTTVTLAVSAEDALKLAVSESVGTNRAILRSHDHDKVDKVPGVITGDLLK